MAQPTNTHSVYDLIGTREDLSDIIANISPMDFPFWTAIGSGKPATAIRTEWQTGDLRAAAANAVIEGDDVTMNAATATKRLANMCQISDEAVTVSGTADAVSKAGRDEELAYQITKKTKELKRDIEFTLCQNAPFQSGNDTTASTSCYVRFSTTGSTTGFDIKSSETWTLTDLPGASGVSITATSTAVPTRLWAFGGVFAT